MASFRTIFAFLCIFLLLNQNKGSDYPDFSEENAIYSQDEAKDIPPSLNEELLSNKIEDQTNISVEARMLQESKTPIEELIRLKYESYIAEAKALREADEKALVPDGGSPDGAVLSKPSSRSLESTNVPKEAGAAIVQLSEAVNSFNSFFSDDRLKVATDIGKINKGLGIMSGLGQSLGALGSVLSLIQLFFPQVSELRIVLNRIDALEIKLSTLIDNLIKTNLWNDAKTDIRNLQILIERSNVDQLNYIEAKNSSNSSGYVDATARLYQLSAKLLEGGLSTIDVIISSPGLFITPFWSAAAQRYEGDYIQMNKFIVGMSILTTQIFTHNAFYFHRLKDPYMVQVLQKKHDALQQKIIATIPSITQLRINAAQAYIQGDSLKGMVLACSKFKNNDNSKQNCAKTLFDDLTSKYRDLFYTIVSCYSQLNGYENNSRRWHPNGNAFCHENVGGDKKCCIIQHPRRCSFTIPKANEKKCIQDALKEFDQVFEAKKAEAILKKIPDSFVPLIFAKSLDVGWKSDVPNISTEQGVKYSFGVTSRWFGLYAVSEKCP